MSKLLASGGRFRNIPTSGSPVPVEGVDTNCDVIVIAADKDNQGRIWIGASDIRATEKNGIPLSAEGIVTIQADQLNHVFVDAEVSGDNFSYYYQDFGA